MLKHILIPVDFSDEALNAVEEAAYIAKEQKAKVTLLHAYLIPGYSGGMAYETFIPPVDEHIELINKQIDDFSKDISALRGLQVDKVAVPGSIQDVIGAYTEDNHVDLVVTATRGASGFKAFLLGTQSERIEDEVKCPVLVIPDGKHVKPGMKLALAHDYKSNLTTEQVNVLKNFQVLFNLSVHVVHVEEKEENLAIEDSIKENLHILNPQFHHVLNDDVEKGLNEFVKQQDIGLLSIIYHDHGFLNRLFGKSTSRQLTYHTEIPLLVLK
ncbi:MAG: universal stress protein [Candidatus Cyclobacteriaceae bacterium M2_1C_046]